MADNTTGIELTQQELGIQFEDILPWGSEGGDTGLTSRLKLKRNFEKIKAWMDSRDTGPWETVTDEETGKKTAHLKSEYAGAWTDGFLSALGKRSDGSDSGIILNEPLKGINEAGLAAPALAQKDMTLVWNGTKWGYGKTGAYTFATGTENGTFLVTPYGGQAQKVSIFGLKALAYKDNIDATLVTSGIFSADRIPGLSWSKITSDKPTTLAGYGIGDAKIANGTITLGGNSITPVTEVKMTVPTGFAVTGSPLTKTGTLALAYAAGYEGFTTALKEKIEALFSWFELDSDGNVKTKDKPNGGGHRGFWTESFVSALGKNDSQSSAFDESAMWTALGGSLTNKQIALSHLTTALSGYVKGVKVGSTTYSPNGSGIVDLGTIEGRTYTFATGTKDGTFKVTPSVGDAYEVAIKGLAALAYKASLTAADIPSLDATKITTGILSADRIPGLSADKITSGTLSVDRIPDLSGKYVTTTFFNKLFRAQDASGNDITVNASTAVDSIKAMVGFWTEQYISALGKNDSSSDVVLNEPLQSINNGVYGTKAAGTAIVWDGSKWVYGKTGGEGTVTAIKVGNTQYTPTNGVVSLPAYPTSLAWGNITGKPTTIGDYGITDAKIENGVITLGTNTITPLTDAKLKSGYEWWGQKLDASGKVNGNITIQLTTVDTNTYADANPKLIFKNANGSQNISLTFTDYDAVAYPASLTLNGNQGNELFIAPRMKADRLYLYKPNGSGDTNAVYLEYDSANGGVHLVGAGFYSDSFVSALGKSDSGSSSVFDESAMWTALGTNSTNKLIASAYLGNVTKTLTIKDGNGTTLGTYNGTAAQTITVLSGNYLPLSGGTLTGNLIVGNTTIYASGSNGGLNSMLIGDDAYIGDCNHGGHLGIKSANGTTAGFYFYGKDSAQSSPIGYFTADNNVAKWNGNTMWHAGNDGANSGLDADLLDGQHGSYYGKASDVTTLQGYFTGGVANSAAKLSTVSKTLWGNTYWTAGGVPTDVGTASSPASLSNVVNITMSGSIGYKGTKATYQMIKFKDNTNDTYGNGVVIGGGGLVAIGGGESADVMAEQHAGGDENLMLGNDGAVDVYTNLQSGWASRKSFSFDTSGNFTLEGHVRLDNYKHIEIKNAGGNYLNVLTFTSANQFVLGEGLQSYPTYLRGNTLTLQTGTSNAAALTINASGLVEVNQNTQGLKIGNAYLVWDSANNSLKVTGASDAAVNFYATGGVSALGMGGSGGGGGDGVFIPLGGSESISGQLSPDTDNAYNLGNGNKRWKTIYSTNATINLLSVNGTAAVNGSLTAYVGSFSYQLSLGGKAVATQEWVGNQGFVKLVTGKNQSYIDGTLGSYAFEGSNGTWTGLDMTGNDWAVLQVGGNNDRWQLMAKSQTLFFRQNDNDADHFSANNWGDWKEILTTANTKISGQTITINGTSLTVPTGAGGDYVAKAGDTMTGTLNINYSSGSANALNVTGGFNLVSTSNSGILNAVELKLTAGYGIKMVGGASDVTVGDTSHANAVFSYGGFKKSGSSDSYVLLGGGGHKALNDLKQKNNDHHISTGTTGGAAAWVRVAKIVISGTWANQPIVFDVTQRSARGVLTMRFASQGNGNYFGDLDYFMASENLREARLIRDSRSGSPVNSATWYLYIYKSEQYENIGISLRELDSYTTDRVSVTWDSTIYASSTKIYAYPSVYTSSYAQQYNTIANLGTPATVTTQFCEAGTYGTLAGVYIVGNGSVGNTASQMISGTAGLFRYGDVGARIRFAINNAADQKGEIIFTDHNASGGGVSWHFVTDQGNETNTNGANVVSDYFTAKRLLTVGQNILNTSYNLYVNGTAAVNSKLMINGGQVTNDSKGIQINASDNSKRALFVYNGNTTSIDNAYLKIEANLGHIALMPGGNVGIGTTNPTVKLDVNGVVRATELRLSHGFYLDWNSSNANAYSIGEDGSDIYAEGDWYGRWVSSSDVRLKDIDQYLDRKLEDIALAPIFSFRWKDKPNKPLELGTSAQYWKEHLSYGVTQAHSGYLALDYGATALAAAVFTARKVVDHELRIKQLQERVLELENELKQLKAA